LGVITLAAIILFLRLKPVKGSIREKLHRIDVWAPCIVVIMLPMNWGGQQYAWSSPVIISLFVVGVVSHPTWKRHLYG
ncbi:hypothetical protein BC938DRAFT_479776, partial [Jimgerdemannia flammicorona]